MNANQRRLASEASGEDAGNLIGRDPRRMEQDELRAIGHEPMSPLQAIRGRCLDCCAGSPAEVRRCVAADCVSWPFRMGVNPWRAPASEARREASRRTLAALRARCSENPGQRTGLDAETPPAAI